MTPCRQGKSAISIITAPSSRKYAPGGASDGKLPYSVSLTGGAAERDFGARIGPWWSFKEFWDRLSTLPSRGSVVPFKFHSKGRRHIPRQRHRVTNWRDYDTALRNRGSLTIWLCVQSRLACSAGERPAGVRIRDPVVWIAGWRETKTLKPIDNVSLGETTSHRAVTTVNAKVASKVSSPEGRAPNRRAKAAWGAEI